MTLSLHEFITSSQQVDQGKGIFEIEKKKFLEVNVQNTFVWARLGSMVGYSGNVRFTKSGMLEGGIAKVFKKAVTGEGMELMKIEGNGKVYLAYKEKVVTVFRLENQSISVNGNDVLAFESAIQWDISMLRSGGGLAAGGLFNVSLSGTGFVAICTHSEPLALNVSAQQAVFTDPNATVAWSSNLAPTIKTDISLGTLLGRSSGETFQLAFQGEGFVLIQPYEETATIGTEQ